MERDTDWRCECGRWNRAETRACGGRGNSLGCGRSAPIRRVIRRSLRERVAGHRIDAILDRHGLGPEPVTPGRSD